MALLVILILLAIFVAFIGRGRKRTPPTRTEQQEQVDELITVVLPTIKNDK